MQTLVNANGKKARSTGFCPRKLDRVTIAPDVDASVKSGASLPTAIGADTDGLPAVM